MLLIRRFEEKSAQMYGLQKIGGFCHLYIGQEAIAVGSIANLDLKRDFVLTAYRDHGHAIACGLDPKKLMAELFAKHSGCSRGKGGSMHMFDITKGMYGGNGIVGAQIPIATGMAFKFRYLDETGVVLCFFGEGAIHQGVFHESLNLAKLWKLPIVYICENNHYGMGTDFHRVSAVHDLSKKGESYGIPGKKINGMDVITVYEEVKAAVKQAQEKGIPMLLEAQTYRYKGHSMSDPGKYRSKEELESYKQQDPILIFKNPLVAEKCITEEEYHQLDEECKKISEEAAQFAEKSPEPPLSSLYEDVLI